MKYYFDETNSIIVAAGKFDGKTVRACAKCHPEDEFDQEYGKTLAGLRCEEKILKKKVGSLAAEYKQLCAERRALEERINRVIDMYSHNFALYSETKNQVADLVEFKYF